MILKTSTEPVKEKAHAAPVTPVGAVIAQADGDALVSAMKVPANVMMAPAVTVASVA